MDNLTEEKKGIMMDPRLVTVMEFAKIWNLDC